MTRDELLKRPCRCFWIKGLCKRCAELVRLKA